MKETELFTYTNLIICAELMVNYQDELKDTPYYKHQIKRDSKSLQEQLEKLLINDLPKLYEVDETILRTIMIEMKSIVESITSAGSDDLIAISQIVNLYKKDKEKFINHVSLINE